MENFKLYVDIVKYKITLFGAILSAGIYLLINKNSLIETIDVVLLYFTSLVLIGYGITGFFINIFDLNSVKNIIKKDIK